MEVGLPERRSPGVRDSAACGLRAIGAGGRALSLVLSTTSFKKRNLKISKNQLLTQIAMVVVTFAMQNHIKKNNTWS